MKAKASQPSPPPQIRMEVTTAEVGREVVAGLKARGYRSGKVPSFRTFTVRGNVICWREETEMRP
jgi:hypothetical protein